MSIPADFRRVLEENDPEFPVTGTPRLVVLYGRQCKGFLQAYHVSAMDQIKAAIEAMPRNSQQREQAGREILGRAWQTEVDRDGRIILPQARREQIGLEGEAVMVAVADYFEIWNKADYEAAMARKAAEAEAEYGPDFNPFSLLPG